jgi:hypothetical protein
MPIITEEYRTDETGNKIHILLSSMNLAIAQVAKLCDTLHSTLIPTPLIRNPRSPPHPPENHAPQSRQDQ